MEEMARSLKVRQNLQDVFCAYLESCPPSIPTVIDHAATLEPDEILVLPYFLLRGRHTQEDIPRIVEEARVRIGKKIKITLCSYMEFDPKLLELVEQKIKESSS